MTPPKMNSVPICVKCGHGANDSFVAQRRPMRWYGVGIKFDGTHSRETLIRTCPRCNYEWEEACKDAQG